MRYLLAVLFLLPVSVKAVLLDENTSPDLKEIYEVLIQGENVSTILNKEFSIALTLKHASERHLIFSDAYLKINEKEKYQIAKWIFSPEQTNKIIGKSGIKCEIKFRVTEVKQTGVYKNMPHVIAKIIEIKA